MRLIGIPHAWNGCYYIAKESIIDDNGYTRGGPGIEVRFNGNAAIYKFLKEMKTIKDMSRDVSRDVSVKSLLENTAFLNYL